MASDPSDGASTSLAGRPALADRVRQLTAVVTALTALVAGTTALVVAAKAGWDQVGPYFANLVRHGDVAIPAGPSAPKPAAAPIDPALLAALDADTHDGRDRARRALAAAIAKAPPASVDALIDGLAGNPSYRTKLGIAVALQGAPGGWRSTDPAAAADRLRDLRARAGDVPLRAALDGAARAARR